jgi:MoxR-like ATPase
VSLDSPEAVREALAGERYLADPGLSTAVFLAATLEQPLLLEGEAGVGKTEVAKALSGATGARLIRLQCHEGIDLHHALYDWDYPRQLLHLRAGESGGLYSERFLLRRPLLDALQASEPVVLLIDEIDRADDEFEAFLLELLSDFQVSIPELGTVKAERPPLVVTTSNRTRELHDALKRRCLYHWIDYPSPEREVEIVRRRVPGTSGELARDVVAALARLRRADVQKPPGIAEGIDWVAALELLGAERLDADGAERTLGAVLKYREDQEAVRAEGLGQLVRGRA